jgi:hypothetical protein
LKRTTRSGVTAAASLDARTFRQVARQGNDRLVSLRGEPVEQRAVLPDGREVLVRVAVPDDSYIPKRELDTVAVELVHDSEHLAVVNTVLDADQKSEALQLAREIVKGLESGSLEPTAGAIEPLAEEPRSVS